VDPGSVAPGRRFGGDVERVEYGIAVRPRPFGEYVDRFDQRLAERGERVLDAGRHLGVGVADDQPVRLEPPERLGEHLAGNAADQLDQLAVAHRALGESVEDDHRPLVRDQFDRQSPGAVGQEDITGAVSAHGAKGTCRFLSDP